MSNLSVCATRTPYHVSGTSYSSSTTVANSSSTTLAVQNASEALRGTTGTYASTANRENVGTLSSSTTASYGNSASNSISIMEGTSSSSTSVPIGTLERNGGQITIYDSTSTVPNITSSSTTPYVTSSSTTPQAGSSGDALPPGTLERNGGYITILTSSSTTPSVSSSDVLSKTEEPKTELPYGAIERNGSYIVILNSSSTTPNVSSSSTTPQIDVSEMGNIALSHTEIIKDIDEQIRELAYNSAYKHEDPEGAKQRLAELQAMRLKACQELSAHHNILNIETEEHINNNPASFSKEEEKAFDLMVQENIMEYISQEKFNDMVWARYATEVKEQYLKEIFEYSCEQLGVKVNGIEYVEDMEALGQYDPKSNMVLIKRSIVGNWTDTDAIKTLVHEIRHAYQYAAIDNPGLYVVSDETRNVWDENFTMENYIPLSEENLYLYRAQPVEWDAQNFAKQEKYIEDAKKVTITYEGSWEND